MAKVRAGRKFGFLGYGNWQAFLEPFLPLINLWCRRTMEFSHPFEKPGNSLSTSVRMSFCGGAVLAYTLRRLRRRTLLLAVSAFTMWGLVPTITHAQNDLGGKFSLNDVELVSLKSVRAMNPRSGDMVVVDSVSNKEPLVTPAFSWKDAKGRIRFAGSILPAQKRKMQIIPKTLTQKWNTFRRLEEGTQIVEWVEDKEKGAKTQGLVTGWVAVGKSRDIIKQDAKLYGLLIDGEENKGKKMFEFSSIARKKDGGSYFYIYTVVNSSGSPLHFEWAGFSQKLAPGKLFKKTIESKKLAKERSGQAKIKLHRGGPANVPVEYIITSPYWEIPQGALKK